MINQILTTPRVGGLANPTQPMGGMAIGPGIAGVASKLERRGIKVYNEKEKYNEWEFLYDLTKDTKGMAGSTGVQGLQNQQGTQAQPQNQTAPTSSPFNSSPFGGQTGFGQQQPQPQPQQQPQPQ